jgi:hypothetical protein
LRRKDGMDMHMLRALLVALALTIPLMAQSESIYSSIVGNITDALEF